jgi:glucose/arabinose dehydrogenase
MSRVFSDIEFLDHMGFPQSEIRRRFRPATEIGENVALRRIRDVRQGPEGLLYLLTEEEDGALLRIERAP